MWGRESRSEARPTGCAMNAHPTPGCKADRDRYAGVSGGRPLRPAKTVQWTVFPPNARARLRGPGGRAPSDLLWANLTGCWVCRNLLVTRFAGAELVEHNYTVAQFREIRLAAKDGATTAKPASTVTGRTSTTIRRPTANNCSIFSRRLIDAFFFISYS